MAESSEFPDLAYLEFIRAVSDDSLDAAEDGAERVLASSNANVQRDPGDSAARHRASVVAKHLQAIRDERARRKSLTNGFTATSEVA